MGILDPNGAALDAENAIRSIAKLKNVTGHTLDGKIFVDTADGVIVRLLPPGNQRCRESCRHMSARWFARRTGRAAFDERRRDE